MKPPSPWFYRLACLLAVLLAACQPASQPRLHTTISADGEMIATLLNAGTAQQLVRVRKLTPDQGWEQIQLPPLTGTIQFASHGRDLLLTYRRTDTKTSVLARVNLDNPAQPPEKIYEADDLAFPVEISPGQIMVRTRRAGEGGDATKQFYLAGYHWILLGIGGQVTEVGPDTVLPYPAPNIVGSGFFWMEEQIYEKKDPYPQIMAYPLPGGKSPVVSRKRFEKNTWAVDCDRKAARCLRLHITNLIPTSGKPYIYNVDTVLGTQTCKMVGLVGHSDDRSVTPDGTAAVMSLAFDREQPAHVVVMRFDPTLCEAKSIQHINF